MINYVMLTWNRQVFLSELFKSFYDNIENSDFNFFIVDNGSTDDTPNFLAKLSKNDNRFKVFFNNNNNGLEEYKKLLKMAVRAPGAYIVIIDDDVLEFPKQFDQRLINAMKVFPKVGFLALDVVQNEYTNGAKPSPNLYTDEKREGIVISKGPAGGWCSIMRKEDYKKISFFTKFRKFDMSSGEDSNLVWFLRKILGKIPAILKNEKCLHASGPYYSKKYGYLERDIEKYDKSGLLEMRDLYISYRERKFT